MIAPGEKLSRYHLREPLGSGGMSCVYRAYDPALDREVAIKVLPAELARDANLRERFHEEARALGRVEHPNLIRIFAVGQEGLVSFYSMELITGTSLRKALSASGRLTVGEALAVMGQALNALAAVHQAGIVHRDLKPGNIMLDASGRVVLMDFGLARRAERQSLTASGTVLGTPEYMSPEQARGEKADERSDLYSAGVALYEMLCGRPPFGGKDTIAILRQHVQAPVPPLRELAADVPPELERILGRLLAKRREERYPDVAELLADLVPLFAAGQRPERVVQELVARAARASQRAGATRAAGATPRPSGGKAATRPGKEPATEPAGKPAGEASGVSPSAISPSAVRSERIRTWVAVISAVVAVLALIVAIIALVAARPGPLGTPPPITVTPPTPPAAGTRWIVTERDKKEFEGELVAQTLGPAGETVWVFRLPNGEIKNVASSRIRRIEQKGGANP